MPSRMPWRHAIWLSAVVGLRTADNQDDRTDIVVLLRLVSFQDQEDEVSEVLARQAADREKRYARADRTSASVVRVVFEMYICSLRTCQKSTD